MISKESTMDKKTKLILLYVSIVAALVALSGCVVICD